MNEEQKLPRPLFLSNVSFICPMIRVNRLNINFGIASKPGERGDGQLSSCTNFGVRTGNYDCFNWKQALFGEWIPKKYSKKISILNLLRGITLWTIWIERYDKVFNQEQ